MDGLVDDEEGVRSPTIDLVYDDAEPSTSYFAEHTESFNEMAGPTVNETDYDALYDRVHLQAKELAASKPFVELRNVQHPALIPELRCYQAQAVNWMLQREEEGDEVKGGILADEMGLGKTVEVLALILNHPREEKRLILPPDPIRNEPESDEETGGPVEELSPKKRIKLEDGKQKQVTDILAVTPFQNIDNIINQVVEGAYSTEPVKKGKRKRSTDKVPNKVFLTNHYNATTLAPHSGLNSLYRPKPSSHNPIFLCVCGKKEATDPSPPVECSICHKKQHSSCVHHDLEDPLRGPYHCPRCWKTLAPLKSGATLIITPSSISSQWIEEIQHHVKANHLKVLFYAGVNTEGYQQPLKIAQNDVVITTYDVLKKELYFAKASGGQERPRRTQATYMAPPSPLLSVQFWRICLDEAQMVEGAATRAAEMAREFHTVHRWCVTGTPIQKSIRDLDGLFDFLHLDRPKLLYPDDTLVEILAKVFRRTRKSQVADQIRLPPQTEEVHWLSFSAIEEHFYQQQHTRCGQEAVVGFEKYRGNLKVKLSAVDPHTLNGLLFPLLSLRQACVHPQMVRGQFLTLRPQTKTLSMDDLLKTLVKRAQLECEEAQRLRVSAANGQAALYIIREQWELAAEKYRDVLRWSEELKDSVKTDTLQRLHTLHNLAFVLKSAAGSIAPTLRDGSLEDEADDLKQRYLGRAMAGVEAARGQLAPLLAKASCIKSELDANSETLHLIWWMALLEWTDKDHQLADKMINELKDKLASEAQNSKAIFHYNSFSNSNGLKILLFSRIEEMENQRNKVINRMRNLELQSVERLSQDASDCHLRPMEGRLRRKNRCLLCQVHDDVEDYESLLFRMADRKSQPRDDDEWPEMELEQNEETPTFFEPLRRGTWADSEAEQMLKFIHQFGRKNHAPVDIQEGGSIHLKFLDACKKEFRQIRVVWRQLNDQASAIDELSMATLRLRLRLPHEVIPSKSKSKKVDNVAEQIYLLEPHEIDPQFSKLQGDLLAASSALKRHMGHSLYLKNLEMAGYGQRGNENPDPCPVCQNQLGIKWSVLVCGHSFCMDCTQFLVEQCKGMRSTLRCAICRETTALAEIAYVDACPVKDEDAEEAELKVKGSHSTKVEAIVRQLLQIRAKDPEAKCLVFSTWVDVLLIVGRALDENGLIYCSLFGSHSQKNLSRFKRDPAVSVLLVPIKSGANGLNLTEATHVLLLEPILNPGNELQAVGRVHRIGQTKPTFVHRFLVQNTIEQKMATMLEKHRSALSSRSSGSVKENPVTLEDLKALFHQ